MTSTSMFSAEELPASPTATPDSERDWMTRVVNSCSPLLPLLQGIAPGGWYGKTSPASSQAMPDETLLRFWASSRAARYEFHVTAGRTPEPLLAPPMPTGSHGACLTLNTPAWRSGASVCSLSDILVTGDVPRRYYLSAKACFGILRRAAARAKVLPMVLAMALREVVMGDEKLRPALMQVTTVSREPADKTSTTDTGTSSPALSAPPTAAPTSTTRKRTTSSPSEPTTQQGLFE